MLGVAGEDLEDIHRVKQEIQVSLVVQALELVVVVVL
jgi:hypothetical protein